MGGFSYPFTGENILQAELLAIWEGISMCTKLQISNYIMETYSTLAYKMISNMEKAHWKYSYMPQEVGSGLFIKKRTKLWISFLNWCTRLESIIPLRILRIFLGIFKYVFLQIELVYILLGIFVIGTFLFLIRL